MFQQLELKLLTNWMEPGDDYGKGFTWAKLQKEKLQLAKRYLKSEYKVRVFCACISIFTIEKYESYLATPKVDET